MTYGLNPARSLDDAAPIGTSTAAAERFARWRKLDEERRLQAVERALKAPANDLIDGYPLAL